MGSGGSEQLRVLVVHHQLFTAQAIALALGGANDLVGRACLAEPQLAVAEARAWPADVAIVALPEGSPVVEALQRGVSRVRIVGLARAQDGTPWLPGELGLAGAVLDSADVQSIAAAVRAVASGYLIMPQLDPNRVGGVAEWESGPDSSADVTSLTPREREIVGLAVQGLADRDIARVLGVSLSHVRARLKKARARIGASTRMQLVGLAIRLGGIR